MLLLLAKLVDVMICSVPLSGIWGVRRLVVAFLSQSVFLDTFCQTNKATQEPSHWFQSNVSQFKNALCESAVVVVPLAT